MGTRPIQSVAFGVPIPDHVAVTVPPGSTVAGLPVRITGTTVNTMPLLAIPPTVTTTLPVVAPAGTGTRMLVADQVVGVALVPLKVTVLVPLVAPKLVPVIVTAVATGPLVGARVVMVGGVVTVNTTALLARPPTVTTTLPVVAPAGTGTTILVADHVVGVAVVPLNLTVLAPLVAPKLVPVIVTGVATGPLIGDRVVIVGAAPTVKPTPLLALPPTVTTTLPVVAPAGTGTTMLVADQMVGVALVPLKVTVLVPCGAPKFEPAIVTNVVTRPLVGERLVMMGAAGTSNKTSAEYALVSPPVL